MKAYTVYTKNKILSKIKLIGVENFRMQSRMFLDFEEILFSKIH